MHTNIFFCIKIYRIHSHILYIHKSIIRIRISCIYCIHTKKSYTCEYNVYIQIYGIYTNILYTYKSIIYVRTYCIHTNQQADCIHVQMYICIHAQYIHVQVYVCIYIYIYAYIYICRFTTKPNAS